MRLADRTTKHRTIKPRDRVQLAAVVSCNGEMVDWAGSAECKTTTTVETDCIQTRLLPPMLIHVRYATESVAKLLRSGRTNFLTVTEAFDVSGLGGTHQPRPIHSAVLSFVLRRCL